MASIRRRTIGLPDNLSVTILRLPNLTTHVLKAMLAAQIYVLCGESTGPDGHPTGFGAYVGISAALEQTMARSGVSLRNWAFHTGRLRPEVVMLVNRAGRPMDPSAQLLIEATLARAISSSHTILNTRTSAVTAGLAASRHQRLWAQQTSQRLAGLVLGQVFHPHPPVALGGTTREQLIRLVLAQGRPMNVQDVLFAARCAGIIIGGKTPVQSTRRDLTTREHQGATGRPRLPRTHIGGLAVIYPAHMSLRQARADYAATHPGVADRLTRPTPQTTPSLHTKRAA